MCIKQVNSSILLVVPTEPLAHSYQTFETFLITLHYVFKLASTKFKFWYSKYN